MKNYRILHHGVFDRIDVDLVEGKRTYSPAIQTVIDREWDAAVEKNPSLYNGVAYSLERSHTVGSTLKLLLQETDYKSFIGTNATHASTLENHEDRADIVAACCICITSDHKVFLGKRSTIQAQGEGKWHVVGGNLDIPDPFQLMIREIVEETGIYPEHILDMRCMALGICTIGKKPELLFSAELSIDSEQMEDCLEQAPDRQEHSEVRFVAVEDLPDFMREHSMVPVCEAAIEEFFRILSGI